MRTLERRISELEKRVNVKPELPVLFISPDTTFAEARAEYEGKAKKPVTDEEFRKVLPDLPKVIWEIVTHSGTRRCEWLDEFTK